MTKIYKCETCGDEFYGFKMDSLDEWNFCKISDLDSSTLCKGCIYKILYDFYRAKVYDMKKLVNEW